MSNIVTRFGDAIWSTFCGLAAAIILMFINSTLETRFARLTQCRTHVRDVVAKAKRELAMTATVEPESTEKKTTAPEVQMAGAKG